MNKVIVIAGYLAAGKSTFATKLSSAINVPYLIKDSFKTAICENVSILNREDSRRFSAITFDAMMYVTERLIETGNPVIIEGNFKPYGIRKVGEESVTDGEAGVIKSLINRYNCESLTYLFTGDTKILYKRFIEREKSPQRGANKLFEDITFDEFNDYCVSLGKFDVGGNIIKIDSTDFSKIDFNEYIDKACLFIKKIVNNGRIEWTLNV